MCLARTVQTGTVIMYNQHRIVIVFVAFMEDGRMVIRKIKLIIKLYFQVSGIECCVVFSINYHHRLDIKYSAANNIRQQL